MKRLLTSVTASLVLLLAAGSVRADSAPVTNKDNAISANPLALAFGGITINYEHKLKPKASITGQFQYFGYALGGVTSAFVGIAAGYRMYFQPVAPDGFYWEPFLAIGSQSVKVDVLGVKGSGSGITFAPGVLVGRQWVWPSGFLIDLALGAGFYVGGVDVKIGTLTYSGNYSGFGLAGKFALGYAWK